MSDTNDTQSPRAEQAQKEQPATSRTSTINKLASALEAANAPKWIIMRAWEGLYDTLKSTLVDPIGTLIHDASHAHLPAIAEMARRGDFNVQDFEAVAWANSDEGRAAIARLIRDGRAAQAKQDSAMGRGSRHA